MYQVIKKHPPLVEQYSKKLINEKVVTEDEYKVHVQKIDTLQGKGSSPAYYVLYWGTG